MKFELISNAEPKDKFQTFISLFDSTISFMALITANELKLPLLATPKCLTLNLPHPSSSSLLMFGPSTIIELTIVP